MYKDPPKNYKTKFIDFFDEFSDYPEDQKPDKDAVEYSNNN